MYNLGSSQIITVINILGEFPGSPVVKTSPPSAGGEGSIPGQGAKIPHALGPKPVPRKKHRSNTVTSSITTLKMVHIEKILKN